MKRRIRLMGLCLVVVLCTSILSVGAFARLAPSDVSEEVWKSYQAEYDATYAGAQSGNGWSSGSLPFNDYNYTYTLAMDINRAIGEYRSHCSTQAMVKRMHSGVTGRWLTKNYGYQSATGVALTVGPTSMDSESNPVLCPVGAAQVVEYTRGSGYVTMYGDTVVTGNVAIWA